MRPRGYTVTAHVKTTTDTTGKVVLTESGVCVAGSSGETAKQVS